MANIEEHHARVYLWRVLESLADGSTLVLGRISAHRVEAAIVRGDGSKFRIKANGWDEALRRLATQLSIEVVSQEGVKK